MCVENDILSLRRSFWSYFANVSIETRNFRRFTSPHKSQVFVQPNPHKDRNTIQSPPEWRIGHRIWNIDAEGCNLRAYQGFPKYHEPSRRRQAAHRQWSILEQPPRCLIWYIIFFDVYRCIKWLAYPTRQLMLDTYLVPCILLPIHSSIHVPWYTPALHFIPLTSQPHRSSYSSYSP